MKKHLLLLIAFIIIITLTFFGVNHAIGKKIDDYAITRTEQLFGVGHLNATHEAFIGTLAQEMGITTPFFIRKANCAALAGMGYYNVFVYHPLLWRCIPISSHIFLYISEGFFDYLSPDEQRFVIGHELIHIKECHAKYHGLLVLGIFILLLLVWELCLHSYQDTIIRNYIPLNYHRMSTIFTSALLTFLFVIISEGIGNSIRRSEEWEADRVSVKLLNSHDGGIAFINRLSKEFGMPMYESYAGSLLSDHPSLYDRKNFFLSSKPIRT